MALTHDPGRFWVGLDARPAYAARPRGVGKTLLQTLRALVELDPAWGFLLYRERGQGGNLFPRVPAVREVEFEVRGDRFHLWERMGLPARILLDRPRLFHAPTPILTPWIAAPFVVTVHDLIPVLYGDGFSPREIEAYRRACERNVRAARMVITVSHATRADLLRLLPVEESRVRVVYWAPPSEYYEVTDAAIASIRSKHGLTAPYFLALAGGSPRKNVARILQAFAAVAPSIRRRHRLLLVGLVGKGAEEARACARRSGVEDALLLPGYVPEDDLPALFGGARALLYVSLYEGFGLPLLEAMAAGTPVLASDRTSIPEVAAEAALYVNPEDVDAMRDAIERLAEDEGLRSELIARGRARAREFTWGKTARALLDVYRAALEGPDAA